MRAKLRKIILPSVIIVICSSTFSGVSYASTQTSRYSLENKGLKPYQIDLLSQSVSIQFNSQTETISDAIEQVLAFSGYQLLPLQQQQVYAQTMLMNPLPNAFQTITNATIRQVLTGIMGNQFYVVVDPVNRLIAFRLKTEVEQHYRYNDSEILK